MGIVILTLYSSAVGSQDRVRSLSDKVKCDCGCGYTLSECPHKQCTRTPVLKRELADAVTSGKSDDEILNAFAKAHGSAALLAPSFHGFNTLLWIVPVLVAVGSTVVVCVYRFRANAGSG